MTHEGTNNCRVKRVLVDTGATKNILYYKCFQEMGMSHHHMKSSNMVLEGFTAHKIGVKGRVRIRVTLNTDDKERSEEIKFYVVDIDSPYNAILGTSASTSFELIISMSHQ